MARVGVIINPDDPTDSDAVKVEVEASKALGLAIRALEARAASQLQDTFATARREGLQGLDIANAPLFVSTRSEFGSLGTWRPLAAFAILRSPARWPPTGPASRTFIDWDHRQDFQGRQSGRFAD